VRTDPSLPADDVVQPPHASGHSHGPTQPASPHTRHVVVAILVPAIIATVVALIVLWPDSVPKQPGGQGQERAFGEVTAIAEVPCPADDPAVQGTAPGRRRCGTVDVKVTEGRGSGTTVTVDLPLGPGAPDVRGGDKVTMIFLADAQPGAKEYAIDGHQRGGSLLWLLALAAAVIIAFGRWRGLSAIAGLAMSFAVLLLFIIPAILAGSPPLLVAVVGASAIMFGVLYLTHGVNVHTSVAILGTLLSLLLTGLLGAVFTAFTHLTGVGDENSAFLSTFQGEVDMRGLLLAGIIIGSLGVLDDVTVTQATTVAELSRSPMTRLELYRSAIRIGRAHVASAVNTIVLAYAGASLPLLLLIAVSNQPVGQTLTSEFLAQEIVRSAVGTIGLVASVPMTTALAALVADRGAAATPTRRRHRTG
jgi:uncharacterized membrane protein